MNSLSATDPNRPVAILAAPKNAGQSLSGLAARVTQLRKDRLNTSQEVMASRMSNVGASINAANLSKIETQKTDVSVERLVQMCIIAGTHPNYMLGWSGHPDRVLPDLYNERLQRLAQMLDPLYMAIWIANGETLLDFQDPTSVHSEDKQISSRLIQLESELGRLADANAG